VCGRQSGPVADPRTARLKSESPFGQLRIFAIQSFVGQQQREIASKIERKMKIEIDSEFCLAAASKIASTI
jgi:hypothetical protein